MTTLVTAALALAVLPGCRQLFGIDDTEVAGGDASGDAAVVADASTGRNDDGPPDAPPPPPDAVVATCSGYMQLGFASPPGATYRGVTTSRNWGQARSVCQNDGADLVVVDDALEAAAVAMLVEDLASPYLWVGVYLVGGVWTSVRGGPATYLPWAAGEPSGGLTGCALIEDSPSSNALYDFACASMQVFVCECLP